MSKRQILIVLGVWVIILFRLGFPPDVKQILAIITGVFIIAVAYKIKPEFASRPSSGSGTGNFPYSEHRNE